MIRIWVARAKIRHTTQLGPLYWRRGTFTQIIHVTGIHTNNQIKIEKIVRCHWPRTMCQLIPTPGGMSTHTRIRQFAPVIAQNARRINLELIGAPCLFYQSAHHAFSSRRTADIAQTDKKYLFLHHIIMKNVRANVRKIPQKTILCRAKVVLRSRQGHTDKVEKETPISMYRQVWREF